MRKPRKIKHSDPIFQFVFFQCFAASLKKIRIVHPFQVQGNYLNWIIDSASEH